MDGLKRKNEQHKSLPPEIIELILGSLPAKSLGRFKSVSKTWNSLISDPLFIKTHVHRHQTTKCILVSALESLHSIATDEFESLDITATAKELVFGPPRIQWKTVLGFCKGLVLAEDHNYIIFIMNPTTRELWKVPTSPFAPHNKKFSGMYGFGYDSSTDDYKVISIRFRRNIFVRSVYSLRKNLWRKLPGFRNNNNISLVDGAVVNHNYHWLTTSTTIHTFTFVDEVFSEIKRPEIEYWGGCEQVIEIGGKLGMFWADDDDVVELWEMQEYGNGNSWTRVGSHKFLYSAGLTRMFKIKERDLVFEDENDELVVFTIDGGARRNVRIVGGPSEFTKFTVKGAYVESIESPNRVVTPT